jgi:hypothetical protein
MPKIIFNGTTYNAPDEMSAADRAAFEQLAGMFMDKNGNGIPDFLEGDIVKNVSTAYSNIVSINGEMVNASEMPEEMRARVQSAFQKMSELGLVTNPSAPIMAHAGHVGSDHVAPLSSEFISSPPIISQEYAPTIQEGNRPSIVQWILLGALLFFCLMTIVVGAFYFLMR